MVQLFWVVLPLLLSGLATIAWQNPGFYKSVMNMWLLRTCLGLLIAGVVWNQAVSFLYGKIIQGSDASTIQMIQNLRLAAEVPGQWWLGLALFFGCHMILVLFARAKLSHDPGNY